MPEAGGKPFTIVVFSSGSPAVRAAGYILVRIGLAERINFISAFVGKV